MKLTSPLKTLLILLFLFKTGDNYSQQDGSEEKYIDSLKNIIATETDNKIVIEAYIVWDNIIYLTDPELDYEINKKIETISKNELKKNLSVENQNIYKKNLAFAYNSFGIIYKNKGDFDQAILNYSNGLKIYEELSNDKGVASALNNIGNIYFGQNSFENALDYYLRSAAYQKDIGDKNMIAASFLNVANVYQEQKDYEKSIEYYDKSLLLFNETGEKRGEAASLLNLGVAYFNLKKYDKALDFCQKSLKINKELDNQQSIASSLSVIGKIYIELKDFDKAISYSKRALEIAQKIGSANEIMEASDNLYRSFTNKNNYKEALKMHKLYISSLDSILSEENQQELIRQEYKSVYEKQAIADSVINDEAKKLLNAEIAVQKAVAEKEKSQKERNLLWSLASGLVLFIIVFSLLKINTIRKKANTNLFTKNEEIAKTSKELSIALDEKSLLLKEIHHRVKNNLQTVSSLLSLQSRYLKDEQAFNALEESQNRILSIYLLHQKLYQSDDLPIVVFGKYAKELTDRIAETCTPSGKDIKININCDELICDIDLAMPLGLIINELITNSYKYAFQKSDVGEINISLQTDDKIHYQLKISDNGIGVPIDLLSKKNDSMGINLVKLLTRQIKGKVKLEEHSGAHFFISFEKT